MAPHKQTRTSSLVIPAHASITPSNFAPYGEVIQNPATHDELDGNGSWRLENQSANQGTATKWLDVTTLQNWYERAASKKPARSVVNMFVCKPRKLRSWNGREVFDVKILERHPYTPQTFVPMGVSRNDSSTKYLVIVAPTLKATGREAADGFVKPYPTPENRRTRKKSLRERLLGARPNPFTNDHTPSTTPPISNLATSTRPKGPGGPDLNNLQAFIVRGDQAVTYGPGTWHAPMVVLGDKEIEFVVVQYANGVGLEDCQEVEIEGDLAVDVNAELDDEAAGPGIMRAKL